MKLKIFRWIALIVGTGLIIPFIWWGWWTASPFAGMVGDIPYPSDKPLNIRIEYISEFTSIIIAFLIPVAVLIAWFKNKAGGYLLTVLALLLIIVWVVHEFFFWIQIAIIPVGPLLLFYVYYNQKLQKMKESEIQNSNLI